MVEAGFMSYPSLLQKPKTNKIEDWVGPKAILDITVNTIMPTLMPILRIVISYQTTKLAYEVHS
jgi:hypothetical protein